jgi:HD superfamily phosphodiesterase
LALRRNLNVEIATICGMLHDIHPIISGNYENHGIRGVEYAKNLLEELKSYSNEEILIIVNAISRHSDKNNIQEPYDEILKDADVMSHCLYNYDFPIAEHEKERLENLLLELNCNKKE